MSEQKIRPCPFCGHAPELFDWCESFEISCENDDCGVQVNAVEKTKELVAAQWNGPDPWQPIVTAPKDETPVILWHGGASVIAIFMDGCWIDAHGEILDHEYPTHWMPLPEGPKS